MHKLISLKRNNLGSLLHSLLHRGVVLRSLLVSKATYAKDFFSIVHFQQALRATYVHLAHNSPPCIVCTELYAFVKL